MWKSENFSILLKRWRDVIYGPSTHDEEFAGEYSTNIRRRRIYNFNSIYLAKLHFLLIFLLVDWHSQILYF